MILAYSSSFLEPKIDEDGAEGTGTEVGPEDEDGPEEVGPEEVGFDLLGSEEIGPEEVGPEGKGAEVGPEDGSHYENLNK